MEDKAKILDIDAALLSEACAMIAVAGTSCVVARGGQIIHTADGRGVAPLLALYHQERDKLKGSCVVDRVIGKAAAMILVLGGVKAVYGEILSAVAGAYLSEHGIAYAYGACVDGIINQTGTGLCPIEGSVLAIDDPVAGLEAIIHKVQELRSGVA